MSFMAEKTHTEMRSRRAPYRQKDCNFHGWQTFDYTTSMSSEMATIQAVFTEFANGVVGFVSTAKQVY